MARIRRWYLLAGTIIMLLAFGFSIFLGITGFDIEYRSAIKDLYVMQAARLSDKIHRGLEQGKTLVEFHGIENLLTDALLYDALIRGVHITDLNGRVIHSTQSSLEGSVLPPETRSAEYMARPASGKGLNPGGEEFWYGDVISDGSSRSQGHVYLQVSAHSRDRVRTDLFVTHIFAAFTFLLAGIGMLRLVLLKRGRRPRVVLGVFIAGLQLSYGLFALASYQHQYERLYEESASRQATFIRADAERLLSFAIEPRQWKDMDVLMASTIKGNRIISGFFITDTVGRTLYSATHDKRSHIVNASRMKTQSFDPRQLPAGVYQTPIRSHGVTFGYTLVQIDQKRIFEKLGQLALELLSVLLVSSILGTELTRLVSIFVRKRRHTSVRSYSEISRGASFLFHFGALMPLSFIPVYLDGLLRSGLPALNDDEHQSILSILITAYMVGIAVAMPLYGFLAKRLSIRGVMIASGVSFLVGTLGTALAGELVLMALMRAVSGLGFGLASGAGGAFVAGNAPGQLRGGNRNWTTGFAGGTLCAFSFGGLITGRFGYDGAFMLTGVLMAVFVLFMMFLGRRMGFDSKPVLHPLKLRDLSELIRNRDLASLMLFSALPLQLAMVGLFQYIFPLYMSYRGLSQPNISQVLAVYGLVSLAAPLLRNVSEHRSIQRMLIVTGNLIAGIVLIYCFMVDYVLMLIIAVAAIGLAGLMIDGVSGTFIRSASLMGSGEQRRATVLFSAYERVIATFVPILTALMMSFVGISGSIGLIGAISMLGAAGFALLTQHEEEEPRDA